LKFHRCLSLAGSNFARVAKLLPTAERAHDSFELGTVLGSVLELVEAPKLYGAAGETGERHQFATFSGRKGAVGPGNAAILK